MLKTIPFLVSVIFLVGCGATSNRRFETARTCRLNSPIELGTATFTATPVVLQDSIFHQLSGSHSVGMSVDEEATVRLFQLTVGGVVQTDMLGIDLPGRTAGFATTYTESLSASDTDEEGFRHLYPEKRNLASRVQDANGLKTYSTNLAEKAIINDKLVESTGSMITALKVFMEGTKLVGVEVNWPITNDKEFRLGEFLQPRLDKWQDGKNETLCLKKGRLPL